MLRVLLFLALLIQTTYCGLFAQSSNTFPQSGAAGIGTTSPRAILDVATYIPNGQLGAVLGRLPEGDASLGGTFLGVRGFTTRFDVPGFYYGKSFSLEHSFYGEVNSSINFMRGEAVTGGFMTFNTRSNMEQMRLDENGNLMLGTTTHRGARLAVNGSIRAQEIKVEATNWPDYVFEKDYALPTLEETAQFIAENGHLPEIPKASAIEADGLSLGEMNKLLLKKIEELTLHVIQLNNTVNQQAEEIDFIKNNRNQN